MLGFLRTVYAHMEWADALIWRSVLDDQPVEGDDFIIDSLVHIHIAQRAWLGAWNGVEVGLPTRDDFGSIPEIRDWGRSYHREMPRFLETLTDERLREVIAVPWTELIEKEIGGPAAAARLGDTIYQVAAHSAHHRAQINRRIREVGGSPEMVDYIGWIWRGRPAPDWTA